MSHSIHDQHTHVHGAQCGHLTLVHNDHVDYLHNGHLHSPHEGHYDEHVLEVTTQNPSVCAPVACACGHQDCGHPVVPHGDHQDYLFHGRIHHPHGDHCDDHGPVTLQEESH